MAERTGDAALADRLVNYADAIVALSIVGVSGLGIAVAEPEARESIARGANWVILSNAVLGTAFAFVLHVLRRWELDLRSTDPPSDKAQRYGRRLHGARFGVLALSVVQAIVLMLVIR